MFRNSRVRVRALSLGDKADLYGAEVTLSKAQILALFATPIVVVAAPGAGKYIELTRAVLLYDRVTATYGGGGDVTIGWAAGAALTEVISAANSFGSATDVARTFSVLNPAGGTALLANTGLTIRVATGTFTDPGTAAGTARVRVQYRIHAPAFVA